MLDWGMILEGAMEIHTVGTSLIYMLDIMGLGAYLYKDQTKKTIIIITIYLKEIITMTFNYKGTEYFDFSENGQRFTLYYPVCKKSYARERV